MAAVVRNSVLNPLATCFVPSKSFCGEETVTAVKALTPELKIDEMSSETKMMEVINHAVIATDFQTKTDFHGFLNDKLSCGEKFDKRMKKKNKKWSSKTVHCVSLSLNPKLFKLLGKPMPQLECYGIVRSLTLDVFDWLDLQSLASENLEKPSQVQAIEAAIEEPEKNEEECGCPPMFGWVVPPTFFGNPLNLTYKCCKNYVHSPRYDVDKDDASSRSTPLNQSEGNDTLEQCLRDFEATISDICNIVNDVLSDENENPEVPLKPEDEWNESKDCVWNDKLILDENENPEVPLKPEDESNESKDCIWNDKFLDEVSSELIDDGYHPLLQPPCLETPENEGEENHESIKVVENMLVKCLLPSEESTSVDICPCSVWCPRVPSAARDTYARSVKMSQQRMGSNAGSDGPKLVGGKPSFKRSFSEGDAPMYANPCRDFTGSTSEMESQEKSREKLMLLRKDPMAYFGYHSTLRDDGRRYSHPDLLNYQLRESMEVDESSMWGLFDGADSLWKPLPDCLPSNECNQRQNAHRKAREMRRQRSLN